jgi:hypothetical protein
LWKDCDISEGTANRSDVKKENKRKRGKERKNRRKEENGRKETLRQSQRNSLSLNNT